MPDLLTSWHLDSRQFNAELQKTRRGVEFATRSATVQLDGFSRAFATRALSGLGAGLTIAKGFDVLAGSIAEARREVPELGQEVTRLQDRWDRLTGRLGRSLLTATNSAAGPVASLIEEADKLIGRLQRGAGVTALRAAGLPAGPANLVAQMAEAEDAERAKRAFFAELERSRREVRRVSITGDPAERDRIERDRVLTDQSDAREALTNRSLPADEDRLLRIEIDRLAEARLQALEFRRRQADQEEQRRTFEAFQRDGARAAANIRTERALQRRLADLDKNISGEGFSASSSRAYGLGVLAPVNRSSVNADERADLLEQIADVGREQAELLRKIANVGGGLAP